MALFTKTEEEEIELRLKGLKKNYAIWYRVKPKINELLNKWFPLRNKLKELIK